MGDNDDGTLVADVTEGAAQLLFGLPVEAARRLIQQQHRRIADQGPGNGDSLPLATGKPRARFADFGGVTVGHVDDKFVNAGGGGRLDELLVGGFGEAVDDVVADGAGEEYAFLGNVTYPAGQLGAGELADIGAIEENPAFAGLSRVPE